MPHSSPSLIELAHWNPAQIQSIFDSAKELQKNPRLRHLPQRTVALLFFEPSTRTRFSFETAVARLGMHPLVLEGKQGTSLEKGESYEDTVMNIAAMGPEALVIRCGDSLDLYALQKQIGIPILSAGWGTRSHPTQALLDALTLMEDGRELKEQKLLIVGDVKHSRVASSHLQLAALLGYEVAVCGPAEFLPVSFSGRTFSRLEEGVAWATAVMALRVQHERHERNHSLADYHARYGVNLQKMKSWKPETLLLHPGPVNFGVELDEEVRTDSRCQIFSQVRWGVPLRQALLLQALSEKAGS